MSEGKRSRGWALLALALAAGCGDPPHVVTMGPPGAKRDVLPQVAKDRTASSVGEAGVAPARKVDPPAEVPSLEPTEPGVEKTLDSGLKYTTIKPGREGGEVAATGKLVRVHYVGTLDDGTVFDESRPKNMMLPFTIGAGDVIKGWDQGVAGMRVGEVRKLVIPPDLGYGDRKQGPIPPNSTLNFVVELMEVE